VGTSKLRTLLRGQCASLDKEHLPVLERLRGAVWFHAASVGEFEQARTLIERLKREQPQRKVVVTFFSPSGYEARKNYEHADAVIYLPFATRRNAKRFLDALQPSMAIFIKYEFWPAYLRELKKRGIATYSISAIFRPDQVFFRWYGKSQLRLLHCFTHIYVQDEDSRRLLAEHGVHECSVAGDTRFDRVNEIVGNVRKKVDTLLGNDKLVPIIQFTEDCERVIVAGSTWPEDEVLLKQYMEDLRWKMEDGKRTKLILVPHEINEEHLHSIFQLFQGRYTTYSAISGPVPAISRRNILQHADVLVMDTIGLLSSVYNFGHAAYIGGGFGVGIHNTIEAAVYGLPVVFGPNYQHFREAKGLIEAGAARSIKNYEELEAALETALDQHEIIGAKAAAYVQSELGATDKIFKDLF
jgi:3-deoxy-D-manno-octulosonic-acid transferase